ncbi:MAG: NnrU family protein [Halopseudomonas aestusnigri]
MGLILLCGGLALFSILHLATATKSIRRPLVGRLGEGGYKGIFALLSFASFGGMLHGYATMEYIEYWQTEKVLVLVQTFVFMPISFVLLVSSYVTQGTRRLTRHPMLVGVTLACFGHVLVNGDLAAIILFGGLGGYCILAMLWSDIQTKAALDERDCLLLYQTSYLPSPMRLRVTPQDILPRLGILGPSIGVVLYGLALTYHGQLLGVSPLSSLMG